ncbi:MAG: 4Fe-4S binding protein, partial [Bacteroidaceae bacterium]|nr:4Fe-4S binding protein [Bacteroidaceae bacterium]
IGCGKCVKVCEKFEAITLGTNLAYIDPDKCKMCRKCEEACPRGAIKAFNFPPRKPKEEAPKVAEAPKAPVATEAPKAAPAPVKESTVETPKQD